MRQRLAPPFHLAESQIRREPERLYKATEHRLPPISSTCCSFVILPSPPRRVVCGSFRAEAHLVYGPRCLCLMVTRLGQLPPRPVTNGLFWELLPKCCHTHAPTHVTGPSCKLSNIPSRRPMMVWPILAGTSGNVAPRTHINSHEVRLVWSTFAAAV